MVEGGVKESPQARRIDQWAMALIALILVLAPLVAAGFATPDLEPARLAEGGLSALMNALGVPILLLLTALATLIVLVREWRFPKTVANIPGVWVMAAGLGIWASASALPAPVKYLSINGLSVLLAALLVGGLIARLGRDERSIMVFMGALIVAGSVIGGIGVREFLFKWRMGDPQMRSFATFTNPNFLAGYLLLTIPATLGAFAAATDRMAKFALALGLALQTACLMLTASRAGAAMMLLSVIAWLVLVLISRSHRGKMGAIWQGVAIVIVAAILAAAPTLSRFKSTTATEPTAAATAGSGGQGHSAEFRKYTWIGTYRMAAANPIMGTGIGSYEAAYPRYTLVGWTQHAHNSYLQWASETGWVGLLLLLGALAAIVGFALRALLSAAPDEEENVPFHPLFDSPKLMIAGLLASLFGSMVHSVGDSDWYVVATLFTLCAVLSLTAILARIVAPNNAHAPQPLPKLSLYVGIALVLGLTYRGITQFMERNLLYRAAEQVSEAFGNPNRVETHLSSAGKLYLLANEIDASDPEPLLGYAAVAVPLKRTDSAKQFLTKATQVAPTGRTFYRLGKFLISRTDHQGAISAFSEARAREPRNLQNLRWLADTQYRARQIEEARLTWESIIELEKSVFGRVRAIPEMIETDFAFAHLGLASIHSENHEVMQAIAEYKAALDIFRAYWAKRNTQENARTPDKRRELAHAYLEALLQTEELASSQSPPDTAEAAKLKTERETVKAEWEKDKTALGMEPAEP
jgi:O-antigen ligase/tetratricopeptide (TPR) repeat protein